ncbi:MAG: hypothetical protein AAB919_02075 [Patescibacteria group bacterium]
MAETAQAPAASTQAPPKDSRPVYEVGFHLIPSITEEGLGAAVEKVRALLGDAEIIAQGFPQKMTLSYTIERANAGKRDKFTQSYFGWVKFAVLERGGIPALEKALTAETEVLRFLIIETVREDIKEAPRRAVFSSDRLEGKTIEKPAGAAEKPSEVSDAELDKSIEALTG